ncbi:unnamed protein product [Brachionus calyciflorus]|uniref:Uncharacterized protein n=1 Tax=Brachionus calyciflorus TaxID=104777 RepID=A0A813LY31_9BILA|nr:unnamed protein product [Brachionus calyciflorus]
MIRAKKLMAIFMSLCLLSSVLCDTQKLKADGDSNETSSVTTQVLAFLDKLVAIKVSDIIKFGFSISNMIRQRRRARLQQQQLQAKSMMGRIMLEEEKESVDDDELEKIIKFFEKGLNELITNSIRKSKKSQNASPKLT